MKKFIIVTLITFLFTSNAMSGVDGENSLSKKPRDQVNDCFEKVKINNTHERFFCKRFICLKTKGTP